MGGRGGAGEGTDATGKWLEVWNSVVLSLPWLLSEAGREALEPALWSLCQKVPKEGGPALALVGVETQSWCGLR